MVKIKKRKLLVCQCLTSKQWEKQSKIHNCFEALQKICQMRLYWLSYLYLGGHEFGISVLPGFPNISYLYCNIEIKRIELGICFWPHFKENS